MKDLMKLKNGLFLLLLTATALFAVGCSKSNSSNSGTLPVVNGAVPVIIDPTSVSGTTSALYSGGSTATFVPVSTDVMNTYVATHPLNAPTNFQINMNLAQASSGRYGGTVSISYLDNGIQYNGKFKAGMGTNQSFSGMYDNGTLESNYNYWFNYNSQLVFSAYFEDSYGAITVTLVPDSSSTTTGGNDAQPVVSGPYKGYVYFKNFTVTSAPQSPYRSCWFIYTGPYDCRSNIVTTKCGLFPGAEAGYQLLGTFDGININSAFNIQ